MRRLKSQPSRIEEVFGDDSREADLEEDGDCLRRFDTTMSSSSKDTAGGEGGVWVAVKRRSNRRRLGS